jgi:hypothetical protein
VEGYLVDMVFHRAKAGFRCVSGSVHLVHRLLHQRLQPVKLGVAVCNNYRAMVVSSKLS